MKNRTLLLTSPESNIQWELRFYSDNTVDMVDGQQRVLGTYKWLMKHETVYVDRGTGYYPVDNMIRNEEDRCRFYAELFYAIAEQELLS